MFHNPPIAIHHDYSQSHLDPGTLPPHVRIVQNWVSTSWGASSVIDAYLAALRLLHTEDAPEWTINLSSADYPIKSAETILQVLRNSKADAFLDYREVSHGKVQPNDALSHAASFHRPEYMRLARKRYLAFSVVHYHIRKLIGRANESFYVSNWWTTMLFTPFSRSFRPFAGDWWHALNTRAASVLLRGDRRARKLRSFYQNRGSAEESYMHTILLNEPSLVVENNSRRYTIWPIASPHPKTLDLTDIPAMVASDALFARKFPFDRSLYETTDIAVLALDTPAALKLPAAPRA